MKKQYSMSLDSGVMEKFKDDCRINDQKYSTKIQQLIKMYLSGRIIIDGDATQSLEETKQSIAKFKKIVNNLEVAVNG